VRAGSLAFAVVLGQLGCNRSPASGSHAGHIEVQWSGGERGRLSGPATAEWCSVLRQLEIRGIQGDTGFAILIHPTDSIRSGQYSVAEPARPDSLPPAAVALRWVELTSVKGFQGESGSVSLHRAPSGEWSGRVSAAARSVSDTQRLAIDGTFKDLVIGTQARGCSRPAEADDSGAEPPDTPLH
jgi:hypothetical protein